LKKEAKRKFDEALGKTTKKTSSPAKVELDKISPDLPEQIDVPLRLGNGIMVLPSEQFCYTRPFFVKTPDFYYYIMRCHLAQDVDVDYDEENRLLKFEIININSLTPKELSKTTLKNRCPDIQVLDKEENLKTFRYVPVPPDAVLDDSIDRYDHDTSAGYLVEIVVPRKKEVNKNKLKGKRFKHMDASFLSDEKLMNEEDEATTGDHGAPGNEAL